MQPREQVDTGVDVGSNETAPARTSADPGRAGRLRGLVAGLLVAVAGLLALPLEGVWLEHRRRQMRSLGWRRG